MKHTAAVVLAAGKGTRVQAPADQNKVTFALNNRPMVAYSVDNVRESGIETIVVVVGHAKESVMAVLGDSVTYADQGEPLGTGHALAAGLLHLPPQFSRVVSLYGDDSAFYTPELIAKLVDQHKKVGAVITFLTVRATDPTGLGRIIRNLAEEVVAIVEEKNATPEQKLITEVNTGLYCFDRKFADTFLPKVNINPISGEYYLTDLIELACAQGLNISTIQADNADCWFGVNTREQLVEADQKMKKKSIQNK
jgi:bifunctional UDP-N-acetylglucosamine pyrophosphorylase/glucosamine-1-phosphate N-acetyltransferase